MAERSWVPTVTGCCQTHPDRMDRCFEHCYAVDCGTCGKLLYDRGWLPGWGENPRPHHRRGEECPKEEPDFSTESRLGHAGRCSACRDYEFMRHVATRLADERDVLKKALHWVSIIFIVVVLFVGGLLAASLALR